jgi:hypothetical protein
MIARWLQAVFLGLFGGSFLWIAVVSIVSGLNPLVSAKELAQPGEGVLSGLIMLGIASVFFYGAWLSIQAGKRRAR